VASEQMRQSSLAGHQNRMKSSDFTSYKFSTYITTFYPGCLLDIQVEYSLVTHGEFTFCV
jgi:hypothetical protein